jgi:hypothetical protein
VKNFNCSKYTDHSFLLQEIDTRWGPIKIKECLYKTLITTHISTPFSFPYPEKWKPRGKTHIGLKNSWREKEGLRGWPPITRTLTCWSGFVVKNLQDDRYKGGLSYCSLVVFCFAIFKREKNTEKESRERDLNPTPGLPGRHWFLGFLEFSGFVKFYSESSSCVFILFRLICT